MLFNSIQFIYFFLAVSFLYFFLPYKYRWFLLLAASCYFYMFFIPYYILILAFTIVIDYFAGIFIEKALSPKKRKLFLIFSIAANVGVLAFFKYYNFANDNLTQLFALFNIKNPVPLLEIVLPIGLSFHTFQAMSYTIEVYRGNFKAERHFGIYALYVMFYPQLVAGPIERPQNVLPQLRQNSDFDVQRVLSGLRMMLWGIFKKVAIADLLAGMVNAAYNDVPGHSGLALLTATYLFSIQIYCDFSGYSDIALGSARIMGINLMENFRNPYFSKSIAEFWKRWHISLSSWFRDYLYIGLGGNRTTKARWLTNLMIVFLVSGLWHGANWTFIIWGALHGTYLVTSELTKSYRNYLAKFFFRKPDSWFQKSLNVFITFNLASFAWIFFRANSTADAFLAVNKIGSVFFDFHNITKDFRNAIFAIAPGGIRMALVLIVFMFIAEYKISFPKLQLSKARNYAYFIIMLMLIIILGQSIREQFIYFQF